MFYTLKIYYHLLLHLFLGPGISKFAHKTRELKTYLHACMQKAKKIIPLAQHRQTPVYLGATAGMRLLRYGNT